MADPIPLNPRDPGRDGTVRITAQPSAAFEVWQLAGGGMEQSPMGGDGGDQPRSLGGTSGLDFRGRAGGSTPSAILRWPGGVSVPPLRLGNDLVAASEPVDFVGGQFTAPGMAPSAFPMGPGTSGGFSDPGFTPPPVVPLPAAAWAGLAALPLVAGTGWMRRRGMKR